MTVRRPQPTPRALTGMATAALAAMLACTGCSGTTAPPAPPQPAAAAFTTADLDLAVEAIRADQMKEWTRRLAADEMQGRLPGTEGEERAVRFIEDTFRDMGLEPAAGESYFQEVPLVGITPDPEQLDLSVSGPEVSDSLRYKRDFMAVTSREQERIDAAGELVFVGYGIVAPEYDWDDYKGMDMTGKVLVMLVNDPPLPDETRFGGKAMTYYGRWTYKYEIGAERGAAGVILIHQTDKAGYGWDVVTGSWAGEQFVPARPDGGAGRMPFESWMTEAAAVRLLTAAGLDLAELEAAAAGQDFTPVPLGLTAAIGFDNSLRRIESRNVAALLPGGDLADQWVIYTAHWDHLGISDPVEGDVIYNGAFDNATGVASLLALARAHAALPAPPRRSVLFLATTAEEQGLIGAYHYAAHPLHPLAQTAAVINMDGMNVYGPTEDVIVVGLGQSSLDDLVRQEAAAQGRRVVADQEPEKGFYYRSDHFPFARKGVPALYTDHGIEYVGRPEGWGLERNALYTRENYHRPSDEFDAAWDLSGMQQDTRLLFRIGLRVAQSDDMPAWSDSSEFKAVRQRSLVAAAAR